MPELFWQDVRCALRGLGRAPGFTTAAVLTLALGLGASIAMFAVVDAAVLRPLPFAEAERLFALWERPPVGAAWTRQTVPYALFDDWSGNARSFEAVAGTASRDLTLDTSAGPVRVAGAVVTPAFFALLQVDPALGGDLADAFSGDGRRVVVSDRFWRQYLGSHTDRVGRTLDFDGASYIVAAVLPSSIPIPSIGPQPDVWLAASSAMRPHRLLVVGRMRQDVDPVAAETELTVMQRARDANATGVIVRPLQGNAAELSTPTLVVLSLAVMALLVIACANVAALVVERFAARGRELAVRASIGATPRRLATQLLIEHLLLWSCGGLAGLAFGAMLLRAFALTRGVAFFEGVTPEFIAIDWRVLLFAAAVTITGALLCGIVPAIVSSRANATAMLRVGGSGSGCRPRARRLMVAGEVALSVALLVNAVFLIASYDRLASQSVGVREPDYLTFRLQLPETRYGDHARRVRFHDALLDRLRATPGVEEVGVASARPLGGLPVGPFEVDGGATAAGEAPLAGIEAADARFFAAAGIPILAGRVFERFDQGANRVAVVNQTLSRRFFADASVVGRRIRFGPPHDRTPWMTIVGVVGDVRHAGLDWEILPEVYVPYSQASGSNLAFITTDLHVVLRTRGGAAVPIAAIHDAVWALDRTLPVTDLTTFAGLVSDAAARPRFRMFIVSSLASLALLLAAIGLFGVLSFVVGRREPEIGVRMALGANRRAVVLLVVREMTTIALSGIAAGMLGGWLGAQLVESLLFGMSPGDAGPYVTAVFVILATSVMAAALPAVRATRVNPLTALRVE